MTEVRARDVENDRLITGLDFADLLDMERLDANIGRWSEEYRSNSPFPHIAIDNFLRPSAIEALMGAFPGPDFDKWEVTHDRIGHFEQKLNLYRYEDFPPEMRTYFDFMNSRPMLEFFGRLTGMDSLIPDPYFEGGGLHMMGHGGRLGIHIDFNRHKAMKLDRRLNALLYLNPIWKKEWNGSLELWDPQVKEKAAEYLPIANRLIVFSTDEKSYHGHPDPLVCPKDVFRKSLALYYYTNGRPDRAAAGDHTTVFKLRPGEKKKPSLKFIAKEIVPPFLWRMVRKYKGVND